MEDYIKLAEALIAFDEYLSTTGLTPKDEQKRRFENIHKHKDVIRAALEPQQAAVDVEVIREKVHNHCSANYPYPYEEDAEAVVDFVIDYLHAQGLLKGGV